MIRRATTEDIPSIVKLLRQFSKEYAAKGLGVVDKDTKAFLREMIMGENPVIVWEFSGSVVGVIGGTYFTYPYDRSVTVCQEMFWFVTKGLRREGGGLLLIDAFIAQTKKKADQIIMTTLDSTPKIDHHLGKYAFYRKETNWIRGR